MHEHREHHHTGHDTTRFVDAAEWAKRFEDPERDRWQQPERVIGWLGIERDDVIADIGSATGYFPVRFARAVPNGRVYGSDIEPGMVNYLNLRALREGLHNLVSLVAAPDDPRIPEPVDIVFTCNTYHHLPDRVAYFSRLRKVLRPGARLVVVDWKRGDWPVGPPDDHKISAAEVKTELRQAGYQITATHDLPYQYVLIAYPID